MDVALTLEALVPAAKYRGSLTANDKAAFDALVWEDDRAKPTWQEMVDNTIVYALPLSTQVDRALKQAVIDLSTAVRSGQLTVSKPTVKAITAVAKELRETATIWPDNIYAEIAKDELATLNGVLPTALEPIRQNILTIIADWEASQ